MIWRIGQSSYFFQVLWPGPEIIRHRVLCLALVDIFVFRDYYLSTDSSLSFFLLTKKPAWLSEFPRSSAAESFSHRSMKRNNQAHPLSHPAWKKHDWNWEPGFFFGLGRSTGEFLAAFVFKDIWRIMYIDRYLVAHISYIYICQVFSLCRVSKISRCTTRAQDFSCRWPFSTSRSDWFAWLSRCATMTESFEKKHGGQNWDETGQYKRCPRKKHLV